MVSWGIYLIIPVFEKKIVLPSLKMPVSWASDPIFVYWISPHNRTVLILSSRLFLDLFHTGFLLKLDSHNAIHNLPIWNAYIYSWLV
jgi:hypothetical protein